ncbi:ABC transporter permease [Candidatus Bathyarchaeota archaeon]|nr:MAG: ABC transporter permease [Candidatus Bathyarchaeota archaeon]
MGFRLYLIKRLINTAILLVFVIVLNFAIFELLPGTQGSIANLIQNPRVSPDSLRHLEIVYGICSGFDASGKCIPASVWTKFTVYFTRMITFDFGTSQQTGDPVLYDIVNSGRLVNTLLLLGVSTAIALVIGIFLGVIAASRRGGLFDSSSVVVSLTTYSLPTFFIGLVFILVFAAILGWFPGGGVTPSTTEWIKGQVPLTEQILVRMKYLFLPALTLTMYFYGGNLLLTRATMTEALTEDYITTARAKGLPERTVLFKHALKNASLPIVTNAALSFGTILSGAIITETVFNWDGMGSWLFKAIGWHDFPVMQAVFYIIALCVIGANLVSDILYGMIDPRIKYE